MAVKTRTLASEDRGLVLILALLVLALLVIVAVTFASQMRIHRTMTFNFKNLKRAEQLASSAESNVIAMLRGGSFWNAYTFWNKESSPWIYGVQSGSSLLGRQSLETALPHETSHAWHLGSTYGGGVDYFEPPHEFAANIP